MENLQVDADEAFNTSHAVSNDAEELREELANLRQDWENLSREWRGAASSAFSSIWGEWLEGATTLVDSLAEASRNLGRAAALYAEQDASAATTVESTAIDMGL